MKKIICLILTLSFVLCSVGYTPLAAETNDELSDSLALFRTMGFTDESDDLQKVLTRADFAFRTAQFLGINVHEGDTRNIFNDVPDTLWSKTAINALYDRKIVSGSDGYFYPNTNISGNEALKILLSVAGYNEEAEVRGGYPGGYLLTASRLKLLKDIKLSDTFTLEDYLLLLYRIVQLNYMMPQAIEGGNVVYSATDTQTVLEFYHNISYAEGLVTASGVTSIYDGLRLENNEVQLGGTVYVNPDEQFDFVSRLGHEAQIYYYDDGRSDKTVVCLLSGDSMNEEKLIYSKDLASVTDNGSTFSIKYSDESGKYYTDKIDRGAVVFKNGVIATTGVKDALNIKHGYMTLVKVGSASSYNVVRIYDGFDMVIGNINNENTDETLSMHTNGGYYYMRAEVGERVFIYDKYDSSLATDISKADNRVITLKNSNGDRIDYEDLIVGDVVTIYKSDDNTHVELVKGMGSITGTIDSYTSSGEVTIGDKTYKFTPACLKNHKNEIKPGIDGKFVLNSFGDIAYMEVNSSSIKLAFLVNIDYNVKGLNNSLKIKLFTVDNEVKVFDVADSVTIDGVRVEGFDKVVAKLRDEDGNAVNTMLCFATNSEGKLNYIDLPGITANESEDTLIQSGAATGVYYVGAKKLNNLPKCIFDTTKTKVFVIPTDANLRSGSYEDDWFKVDSLANLDSGNETHDIVTYRIGLHTAFEDAIVVRKNDVGITSKSALLLIEKITRGINKDGEVVDVIRAYSTGRNPSTYYTKDLSVLSGYNLKKGDLVYFRRDVQGRINALGKIVYSADDGKQFDGNICKISNSGEKGVTVSSSKSGTMYEYAYATEVTGSVLRYGYEKGEVDSACIIPEMIYVINTTDSASPNVYVGAKSEIADYIRAGDECSQMILRTSTYKMNQIYIYK